MHPCKRRAFTVIELLVILVILTTLAAILFPVLAQARESAARDKNEIACFSNLKKLGTATIIYAQDYDQMYPCNSWDSPYIGAVAPGADTRRYRTTIQWLWRLMPYVKKQQIFTCPSDLDPKSPWSGYDPPQGEADNDTCNTDWSVPIPLSYTPTTEMFGYGGWENSEGCNGDGSFMPDWGLTPRSMASVPTPANTYMIADSGHYTLEANWVNNLRAANYTRVTGELAPARGRRAEDPNSSDYKAKWASYLNDPSIYRHRMGSNIAFGDGHAKFRLSSQIMSGNDFYDGEHATEGIAVREY